MNVNQIKQVSPMVRESVVTQTHTLEVNGRSITYIEFLNDKGKVIDQILRDVLGNDIADPVLLEEVEKMFP